jgi:hypothetical protein
MAARDEESEETDEEVICVKKKAGMPALFLT